MKLQITTKINRMRIIYFIGLLMAFSACKQEKKESMEIKQLNEGWVYSEVDGSHRGAASVPGTIHTDLLNNKQIEDPFYRTNERDQQWVDKKDWVYETTFEIEEALLSKDKLQLHFYGLDTYADVFVNDYLVLEAFNMHREWDADIKQFAKVGENHLKIVFHSPIKKGLELYNASPYSYPANNDQSENGELGDKKVSVFTRKAGYHYGWDWGPRFVTSGIWRPVELRAWNDYKIESVYLMQLMVNNDVAELEAEIDIQAESHSNVEAIIRNKEDNSIVAKQAFEINKGENKVAIPFTIENPKLWWSRGLGEPNMYDFEIQISNGTNLVSTKSISTGLRSIKLVREEDEKGESFLFELNGVRVFAKGANYIPNDSFLPRVTKSDYDKVVADAVNANMNMLRIWGGGVYEDDYFYDLCDKNGIMVWQDFMFACSMYPGDEAMLNNIRKEAEDNVIRLRNHPSIVLWCGNNEINIAWHYFGKGGWGWKERYTPAQQEEIQEAYVNIFHKVLPDVVDEFTNNADYWPSSPQAGYDIDKHASDVNTSGDMHYWGVWHGLHRFEDFDKYKARFMSEYGFQSFPELNTVKTYASNEDFDIESDVMAAHQRSGIGNLRIKEYMSWYYKVPTDFEEFLYMSHVLQAEGIGMAIEAHRRAMPYCMGSLYWQINDCWPVASWSSTDYYHNWKAVHYAVKRAFGPIIISATQNKGNIEIYGVSDFQQERKASLKIELKDFGGKVLKTINQQLKLEANTSMQIFTFASSELKGINKKKTYLSITLKDKDKLLAEQKYYFTFPKDQELDKANIDISIIEHTEDKLVVSVKSDSLVRSLFLSLNKSKGFEWSDNYFDMEADESKMITIFGDVANIKTEDIKIMTL